MIGVDYFETFNFLMACFAPAVLYLDVLFGLVLGNCQR